MFARIILCLWILALLFPLSAGCKASLKVSTNRSESKAACSESAEGDSSAEECSEPQDDGIDGDGSDGAGESGDDSDEEQDFRDSESTGDTGDDDDDNNSNTPPTISDIANQSTNENTATGSLAFTIGDTETTLTCTGTHLSLSSANTSLIKASSVVWGGTAPSCTAVITPETGETGTSVLTITVSDGDLAAADSFDFSVSAIPDPPGFTLIPKADSGLAYDYFMMTHEASLSASGTLGADTVTTDETKLTTCAHALHVNDNEGHADCGTRATDKKAESATSVAPATSVTFAQAFWACRNATDANYLVRLATKEEWQRAAKWVGASYPAMWTTYTDNTGGNCHISSGAAEMTDSRATCKSAQGIFDVAGNVKEWVDERLVSYDIDGAVEDRFGYGPVIGRTLRNGLHQVSYRFHEVNPGAGLALAMGADFTTPSLVDRKQYGLVQSWLDPTTSDASTGFRCVAFKKVDKPFMADLALPEEPILTLGDVPTPDGMALPTASVAPENLYIKDLKAEALTVSGTVAGADGSVQIDWDPWTKDVCATGAGSCTTVDTGYSYRIYRFIEPTRKAVRPLYPWALGDVANNPYTADAPLDPLATDGAGTALYTPLATVTTCNLATPANCTYTDTGGGFSEMQIYRYILVAVDGNGNAMPGLVQRYRSPYMAGEPAPGGASAFRQELRFRLAAVFLTDETYQQAQTPAQIMVRVPLDVSGLDHDFFMQKYEAGQAAGGGAIDTGNTNANHPLAANTALNAPETGPIGMWIANCSYLSLSRKTLAS